jgi:hypothetical protein
MKRFHRLALRGCAALAMILLGALAWPPEGRSKTPLRLCEVHNVQRLLDNWAAALKQSWQPPANPTLIVDKYAQNGAVLLPTCANGPLIGRVAIKGYFDDFLKKHPVVEGGFVHPNIGGDCNVAFASGLYTFKLNGGTAKETLLRARYTYIFRRGLIMQHHSSLEPDPPGAVCPH